jgi:hypothetical protein
MSVNASASPSILTVGVGEEFATVSAAILASKDGDVIKVDAGTYANDFATIDDKITLEAVGGTVNMVASETPSNGHAILVVDNDVTIQGFSFSGAAVPIPISGSTLGGNGAGVLYEAGNLTLINDDFFNNQNGLLATPLVKGTGAIDIENSEFASNGQGDGQSSNVNVGDVASLTFNGSFSHNAVGGSDITSRAQITTITNSRIEDDSGTALYSISLPDGGKATIRNSVIQQSANSASPVMISFGDGSGSLYAASNLLVTGDIFINDLKGQLPLGVSNPNNASVTLSGNRAYGLTSAEMVSPSVSSNTVLLPVRPFLDLSSTWQMPVTAVPFLTVIGSGPDTLSLSVSEDAWRGNAEFTIRVDGTQIGGVQTVQALHALGQTQVFSIEGSFGSGQHTATVTFLNDAWDGTHSDDRNLYVDSASIDGKQIPSGALDLLSSGAQSFSFPGVSHQQTLTTSGNTINGAGDALNVVDKAGGNTINGSIAGLTLDASGATQGDNVSTAVGSNNTLTLGGGAWTVASNGTDTIQAGSGTTTIHATGNVTVAGGTGSLTFIGGSGAASVSAGGGKLVLQAGSGPTSVTGGGISDAITAGSGSLAFNGGSGSESLLFGTGASTVHEGLGAFSYGFMTDSTTATNTIFGFRPGTDHLVMQPDVSVSSQVVSGGSTMLTMSNGSHVDLVGVTSSNLFPSNPPG